jgi:ribonuclease P protein component
MSRASTVKIVIKKGRGNCGFPKAIRVKKQPEFDQVIKEGSRTSGEYLVLYRLRSSDEGQKFGIKIARGTKGAVKRNKIKRIIRETLRKNKGKFDPNEKVVVLFRSPNKGVNRAVHAGEIDFDRLGEELERLIK